jgi:predicted nucleotidyltransferase
MTKPTLKEAFIDFIFQDTSLMDHLFLGLPIYSKTEITIRCFSLILLTLTLWGILRPESIVWIIALILISHFINWFFNGHGYQIFYKVIGMRYSAHKAINYVLKLKKEGERKSFHIMIYGSWSRGKASETSDLDIFIVNVQGNLLNSLRMGFISLKYRLLALFTLLSVDIYVIDRINYLRWRSKAKPEERPIILNDPTSIIKGIYGRERKLEEFLRDVSRLYKV